MPGRRAVLRGLGGDRLARDGNARLEVRLFHGMAAALAVELGLELLIEEHERIDGRPAVGTYLHAG